MSSTVNVFVHAILRFGLLGPIPIINFNHHSVALVLLYMRLERRWSDQTCFDQLNSWASHFPKILLTRADHSKQIVKAKNWLFNSETSSQSERYSSKWLIWLACREPQTCRGEGGRGGNKMEPPRLRHWMSHKYYISQKWILFIDDLLAASVNWTWAIPGLISVIYFTQSAQPPDFWLSKYICR